MGESLIQRKDDTTEVLKLRLEAFHGQTSQVCSQVLFLLYFNLLRDFVAHGFVSDPTSSLF